MMPLPHPNAPQILGLRMSERGPALSSFLICCRLKQDVLMLSCIRHPIFLDTVELSENIRD